MQELARFSEVTYFSVLSLLFVNLLVPFCAHPATIEDSADFIPTQDTVRPEISTWNFTRDARRGEDFEAWAQVSDTASGVRNVSLVVEPSSGNRTEYLLTFNGSFYESEIPALQVNRIYDLFILAFDNANNSATSFRRSIDLTIPTTTRIDPNVTFVPVVLSSSIVAVVVIILAYFYDTRNVSGQNG